MTFDDLKNLTAFWLDDLNFGYFTTTQVGAWLNNAQKETQKILLQSRQNFYIKPVQTTLVVNQSDYILPNDFMTLHRAEIVISGVVPNEERSPLAPITLNQQDLVPSQTGTPQFYYFKRNRIVLMPTPSTAQVFRISYSYQVTDMVLGTDVPDVPDAYHEFLAVLATIDGLLKDGRDIGRFLSKREYYETLLKQETTDRNEDTPRSIVTTGQAIGYGMFGY
jgi:hypothetical protein